MIHLRDLKLTRLDRYFLNRFGWIFVANLISFTSLFVLVDAVSNMNHFLEQSEGFGAVVKAMARSYAALIPVIFCQVLGPVVTVSAAMFTVTTVQRVNEFTPILATGRSYQRTLLPLVGAALAISVGVFLIQELWLPRTAAAIRDASKLRKSDDKLKDFKYPDRVNGNLIVFREYDRKKQVATGVLVFPIFHTREQDARTRLIEARKAQWKPVSAGWRLVDATVQEYEQNRLVVPVVASGSAAVETTPRLYTHHAEMWLETDLLPDEIDTGGQGTGTLPLRVLRRRSEQPVETGSWTVKFLSRFFDPFSNFILVLVGLPIIVFFGSRNIFVGGIVAVATCTAYFGFNEAAQDLGVRGLIPARVGVLAVPILFTALGATLYRDMRS